MPKTRDQQTAWDEDQQTAVLKRLTALAKAVQEVRSQVDDAQAAAKASKEELERAQNELENSILGGEDLPRIFDRAQAVTSAEEAHRECQQEYRSLKGKMRLGRCDLRATATAMRRPLPLFDGKGE